MIVSSIFCCKCSCLHVLIYRELGKGAFSVVKYARVIIREKSRSCWPEYAVKVSYYDC